jgi:hypothetical protein
MKQQGFGANRLQQCLCMIVHWVVVGSPHHHLTHCDLGHFASVGTVNVSGPIWPTASNLPCSSSGLESGGWMYTDIKVCCALLSCVALCRTSRRSTQLC